MIPHEDIAKHLVTSDIYIQYSVQEGFCNAVLEAQATGMLCVVSDAEGLAENVLHEITGWVVPKKGTRVIGKTQTIIKLPEIILKHERASGKSCNR